MFARSCQFHVTSFLIAIRTVSFSFCYEILFVCLSAPIKHSRYTKIHTYNWLPSFDQPSYIVAKFGNCASAYHELWIIGDEL